MRCKQASKRRRERGEGRGGGGARAERGGEGATLMQGFCARCETMSLTCGGTGDRTVACDVTPGQGAQGRIIGPRRSAELGASASCKQNAA